MRTSVYTRSVKRYPALPLSLMMVPGSMPVPAFAEEPVDEQIIGAETADATVSDVFRIETGRNGKTVTTSMEMQEGKESDP